jgi:hypothetical protein
MADVTTIADTDGGRAMGVRRAADAIASGELGEQIRAVPGTSASDGACRGPVRWLTGPFVSVGDRFRGLAAH